MKKLNQKGALDAMFVVLLVVLLAFGGFVVWRVTAADNETADVAVSTQAGSESKASSSSETEDDTETDTEETEDAPLDIPEGWTVFSADGINFYHPSEWTTETNVPFPQENATTELDFLVKVDQLSLLDAGGFYAVPATKDLAAIEQDQIALSGVTIEKETQNYNGVDVLKLEFINSDNQELDQVIGVIVENDIEYRIFVTDSDPISTSERLFSTITLE